MMRPPPNLSPTHVPILMMLVIAGGFAIAQESCVPTVQAQGRTPQGQTQSEAIENLEVLLGQYDQGDYHVPTKTSAELATALAVAQATISELQAEISELQTEITALQAEHETLLNEHTALKARCP